MKIDYKLSPVPKGKKRLVKKVLKLINEPGAIIVNNGFEFICNMKDGVKITLQHTSWIDLDEFLLP